MVVFSPQSAALQKKLRHLEVQLNNEKQVKDDVEHKYRYRSCRNMTMGAFLHVAPLTDLSTVTVRCCFLFCRAATSRLDKVSKELEEEVS